MFSACDSPVVWYPKDRRKVLMPLIEERLKQFLHEVCDGHQAERAELEVMPDHVQLLVSADRQCGSHLLLKLAKGRSSRLLRQEIPVLKRKLPRLWTNSSGVSPAGGAPLCMIKQDSEQPKHAS